jgi:hypothetical protein
MPHLTSLLLKMIFTTYKSDAHPSQRQPGPNVGGAWQDAETTVG